MLSLDPISLLPRARADLGLGWPAGMTTAWRVGRLYKRSTQNAHQLPRFKSQVYPTKGFPGGSDGKESTCNAGDLGWEDPLEKGTATYCSILAWRIPMDR